MAKKAKGSSSKKAPRRGSKAARKASSKAARGGSRRAWRAENEHLTLTVEVDTARIAVLDKASGVTWRTADAPPAKIQTKHGVESVKLAELGGKRLRESRAKGGAKAAVLSIKQAGLEIAFTLSGRELAIGLQPSKATPRPVELVYPGPFEFDAEPGGYAVLPLGQGLIMPDSGHGLFGHPGGYVDPAMSFFGMVRPAGSMLAVVESDCDWQLVTFHRERTCCAPCALWLASFGALAYPRELRLRFSAGGSYVTLAKEYRRWAQSRGRLRTLKEKAGENPEVLKLLGGCRLTALVCTHDQRRFKHEVWPFREVAAAAEHFHRKTGQEKAELHVDGWGARGYDNLHPDVLPPNADAGGAKGLEALSDKARSLGYLFCLHDNYWDVYHDAPSFDESLLVFGEDGRPSRTNMWSGGLGSNMCVARALEMLRRNWETGRTAWPRTRGLLELARPTASYLDCFIHPYECRNPAHPLTRRQFRERMLEVLAYARSRKVVLSVEHVKDWAAPLLDAVYWLPPLGKPVEGRDAEEGFIGVPVPLFNLVYHDCVVVPAVVGRSGDEVTYPDSYLRELLYGSIPIFGLPMSEAAEPRVKKELFLSYLHSETGFEEMTEHRFLSSDRRIQQTTFANGVSVLVDFEHKAYGIHGSEAYSTAGAVRVDP